MRRILRIDVCDYENNVLCNLYDSETDVSGNAVDVFITSERNGWKELSFKIPSVCDGEEGPEENYRLDYLIADYRLRTVEGPAESAITDWYLLSENGINHDAFSKTVEVKAGHICQLLKTRQLNLEFSDSEGNNVGTCDKLLSIILDGTGWSPGNVAVFYEDNGRDIKVRSLVESTGVGAFKMISDLCEKFDAKPVYYIDNEDKRTVDILPMNPFSMELISIDTADESKGFGYGKQLRLEPGEIPPLLTKEINGENYFNNNILEFHYDKELKGIKRTLNTESLITRLYAYGSYGDYVTGICDLKEEYHDEYIFENVSLEEGREYSFTEDMSSTRFFTSDETIDNATLIFSRLDFSSRSYIWREPKNDEGHAYHVYDKRKNDSPTAISPVSPTPVRNNMDFLLDFHYYDEVNLLTETMFQALAKYQRTLPVYNSIAIEKSTEMSDAQTNFSLIGESNTGFLKLKISGYDNDPGNISQPDRTYIDTGGLRLTIDINDVDTEDGVIYRSDFDEKQKKYFTWHTCQKLKENGEPVSGSPSVVWIVHNTNPVTFDRFYLKKVDDRWEQYQTSYNSGYKTSDYVYGISTGKPQKITLWANYTDVEGRLNANTDQVFLFCTNAMSGSLGSAISTEEGILNAIENELKQVTVRHPVVFEDCRTTTNDVTTYRTSPSTQVPDSIKGIPEGYGWLYLHNPDNVSSNPNSLQLLGSLFFCYRSQMHETQWHKVYCDSEDMQHMTPSNSGAIEYYYHTKKRVLYRSPQGNTGWTLLDSEITPEYGRIARAFGIVWMYCMQWEEVYKGKNETYVWTNPSLTPLPVGNYAMPCQYGYYWMFTTDKIIQQNEQLKLDVSQNNIYQIDDNPNNIVETVVKRYDVIDYATDNIFTSAVQFSNGTLNTSTGAEAEDDNWMRSIFIKVYENTKYVYDLPAANCFCELYDLNSNWKTHVKTVGTGSFTTGAQIGYIRITFKKTNEVDDGDKFLNEHYVQVDDYANTVFTENTRYQILNNVSGIGIRKGINNLIYLFSQYADNVYDILLKEVETAQNNIKNLENFFVEKMQDLLRETRWQETEYVDGDESKLYSDALDTLHEVSRPEATYDIDFLDLYSSHSLTEEEELADVEWPDITVTDAVHLVDPDIKVNLWGYIDKLNKCYDQPWKTTLEVNTKMNMMGQHSFADIMTKIAEVAKEAKNKQSIYERAMALSSTGRMLAEKLEGTIDANKLLISSVVGGWSTNDKGQMVFESENGLYAMLLSGAGLMIANSKNLDGEWNWRTIRDGSYCSNAINKTDRIAGTPLELLDYNIRMKYAEV